MIPTKYLYIEKKITAVDFFIGTNTKKYIF